MASMQDPSSSSPLRLFVDKERNRVVVAEASADFVNALLSFLTLPLGTIIRLLSNKQTHQSVEVGCINNLYRSVQNFNTQVFWNGICKKMLLWPRNPCEKLCQKLKFNVDDTEPTKYLMCDSCGGGNRTFLSTFAGVSCSCGKLMDKEMKLESEEDISKGDGVFVRGDTMYLISDDLRVLENSPGNTVHHLVQLHYTDFSKLTEVTPNVGLNQIMDLLKRALISKSPLSDVFLTWEDGESDSVSSFRPIEAPSQFGRVSNPTMSIFRPIQAPENLPGSGDSSLMLKITASKSKNKILYAEAEGDFADFLFSFLAMPLGSILKIVGGNDFKLGSMHNLYQSVKGLSTWYTSSSWSNYNSPYTPLLDLKVAPQYGCIRQPLMLQEEKTPAYWYGTGLIRNMMCYENKNGVISKDRHQIINASEICMVDPRCADGRTGLTVGFVKRPALFAVTDDLQVTPLTYASSISFLQKLNAPLKDLEQHAVKIGPNEALNLLGASLTSKAALTNALFHLVKKPKQEAMA